MMPVNPASIRSTITAGRGCPDPVATIEDGGDADGRALGSVNGIQSRRQLGCRPAAAIQVGVDRDGACRCARALGICARNGATLLDARDGFLEALAPVLSAASSL